ncbi:hypothetical protein TL16_g00377 [Triparma laevis f. inornata]|uniref:Uncharacterized protein n=2 Tax=Triparma laevis TaxID=1534972 RepID=A0A9W7FIE5_9STRA|nr:hypothetical protein TL16_g00377 [Triparma laevis f. inornata]GMI12596.1 hypothetical protein TrLO_g13004 [Triparma laevis f. longispina]
MKEKLFIVLSSLIVPAYYFILAYITGSVLNLIWGCVWTLISVPSFLAGVILYSKFSDLKLGSAATTTLKSLLDILGSLFYINASSMQCIKDPKPEDELDEFGNLKRCQNPSRPTLWVSIFLMMSWVLTYLITPLLPSDRALTWSDVMKLNMSRMEGLQFTLFCTFSMEALVMYSLTDDEGGKVNDFLNGLIDTMVVNFAILVLIVLYEHIIKPAICKPSTRSASSSSATRPDDSFDGYTNGLTVNNL